MSVTPVMLPRGRVRVSTKPAETGAHAEHDGDRQREFVHLECGRPLRHDKVDGNSHQLRRERGHTLDLVVAEAELNREVAALDIAQLGKSGAQRLEVGCKARRLLRGQPADADNLRRRLRRKTSRQ